VPTLADRGCRVVSATNPPQSLIFGSLDRSFSDTIYRQCSNHVKKIVDKKREKKEHSTLNFEVGPAFCRHVHSLSFTKLQNRKSFIWDTLLLAIRSITWQTIVPNRMVTVALGASKHATKKTGTVRIVWQLNHRTALLSNLCKTISNYNSLHTKLTN
jgi:hypothetical protein